MKYFVIILVLIGFTTSFLFGNYAYGWWVPLSPEELLEQSETIFVGTVTAITPVDVEYQSKIARNGTVKDSMGPEVITLEEYTVDVEEYLKNPQESDTMKVLRATVGGVPSGPAKISGFEIGDRVLFYLPKDEKQTHFPTQYLPESFKIPKHCDAKSVLEQPRIDGKNSFGIFQDEILKKDNFTADTPMKFVFGKDTNTLYGASIDVEVVISKTDENQAVFQKNIHAESESCQWITSAEWEFTPEKGDYRMSYTIRENEEGGSTMYSYTGFSVIPDTNTFRNESELLEAQESMRAAFHANVDVEGYPIKQIVIGHGIGDGKYIVDVNADFFNSKYWPDIQENITSIIGDKVEIEYKEGEPLNICGEGTVIKDGVCMVVNGKSPSDEEVFSFQVFLFGIFSSIVGLPVFGVVYWWKRKKQRTVVLPVLILVSVLLLLGFFFGAIPNAIA